LGVKIITGNLLMGFYFDEKTTNKELLNNCGDDHTIDSVVEEAEKKLKQRGYTQEQINDYTSRHNLDD